jgi:ApaG protein
MQDRDDKAKGKAVLEGENRPLDERAREVRSRTTLRKARGGLRYESETRSIKVAVKPAYLDDQSDPEGDRYVWSYTVTIENKGAEPVQLMSRVWNITDGAGRTHQVRGPGVVGAQPVIGPGESFQYTSGCPLETASGYMVGCYQMMSASGEAFEAEIPAFLLESPHERRQIH